MAEGVALLLGAALLALGGCNAAPTRAPSTAVPSTAVQVAPTPLALPTDSAEAAAEVVRRYHAAIAARRYDDAYRLWEPGAVGMTADAFARSFARYADYHATVGAPGRIDAGAGQRFVEIPVTVTGTLVSGGRLALEGPVTLHRVADIDGATPEQRRWRIRSSGLKPRP